MVEHVDRRKHVRPAAAAASVVKTARADRGARIQESARRRVGPERRVRADDWRNLLVKYKARLADQLTGGVAQAGEVGIDRGAAQALELRPRPVLERVVARGKQVQVRSPGGGGAERTLSQQIERGTHHRRHFARCRRKPAKLCFVVLAGAHHRLAGQPQEELALCDGLQREDAALHAVARSIELERRVHRRPARLEPRYQGDGLCRAHRAASPHRDTATSNRAER